MDKNKNWEQNVIFWSKEMIAEFDESELYFKEFRKLKKQEGGYYYPLFKFFFDEHSLILLDSEIREIITAVEMFNISNTPTKNNTSL